MKILMSFGLTALLSYAAGFYLPWWSIAVVAFIIALLVVQKPSAAFASAFFALFILWFVLAFCIDVNNQHLLSSKISALFFKVSSSTLIIFITGLIAGLVGGMAALSGTYLQQFLANAKSDY